jgi:hypothetical protein
VSAILHKSRLTSPPAFFQSTGLQFPGVHRMQPYRSSSRYLTLKLPETEKAADEVLVLPTGTAVASAQIETICDILQFASRNSNGVADALSQANAAC